MKLPTQSLGFKITIALVVLLLVLGAATSLIILFGFNRTQDNANERSREALEEEGRLAMQAFLGGIADAGALQLEYAAEVGQRAGRYLTDFEATGAIARYDISRLVRTDEGVWYDPYPNRSSDVLVPNHRELEDEIVDEIAYSAALDALYPALVEGFPGQISGDAYHPVAIAFVGLNGAGRYWPPIGIHETLGPEVDLSGLYEVFGPEGDPDRESVWTTPYEDPLVEALVITAQTPVYQGDTFRGIIEVDLSIERLVEQINELKPTQSGFTFYVDRDGEIMRTDAFDLLTREAEHNEPLAAVLADMETQPIGSPISSEHVTLDGEEFLIAYTPMSPLGGSLAAAAPLDELTEQAAIITAGIDEEGNRTFWIVLISMSVLFVIALAGATYLNRTLLLTPLGRLSAGTRAVAAGDLEVRVDLQRGDELGALADSFNTMVDQLRESERRLEQQVEERTRELTALLEVSRALAANLDVRSLVESMLRELKTVIDYTGSSVATLDEDGLIVVESVGPAGREDEVIGLNLAMDPESLVFSRWRRGEPVVIDDFASGEELAADLRTVLGAHQALSAIQYIRSFLSVPLRSEGRTVGVLSMSRDTPGFFTERHVELAMAVARQAAVAFENASLLEQRERRTRELNALLDVSRGLASTLELRAVMELILDRLYDFVPYAGAAVNLIEGSTMRQVALRRPRGPETLPEDFDADVPAKYFERLDLPRQAGEVLVIDDVRGDSPQAVAYREMTGGDLEATRVAYVRSLLVLPLIVRDGLVGMLMIAHDEPAFFRKEHIDILIPLADQAAVAIGNARLFDQTQTQTRELAALLEVSRAVASTLDLRRLVELIMREIKTVIDYTGAAVVLLEGDQLEIIDSVGPDGREEQLVGLRLGVDVNAGWWATVRSGEAILTDDSHVDSEGSRAFRDTFGDYANLPDFDYIRSWMGVPLFLEGRVVGLLTMSKDVPGYFTPHHVELATAVARQAALAARNARLFEQTQQRAREMAALLEVMRTVASTFDIRELFGVALDQLKQIIDHTGSSILTVTEGAFEIMDARARTDTTIEIGARFPLSADAILTQTISKGDHVIINDVWSDDPMAESYRQVISSVGLLDQMPFVEIKSWMGMPMIAEGELVGMLTLSKTEPGHFKEEHARLVRAFADQVAIGIERARLFAQGTRLAAVEERQRLARELHDSVSQALYGIALGARTARTQLDREPEKAVEPVDYVLSLAEAGLAEMRALIFELRPESLETEGLVAAIQKHAAALEARHGIAVACDLCEEPDVTPDVREAVYRIVQEALTNAVKHSKAANVSVALRAEDGFLRAEIADDGVGFDPDRDYAGHLGLHSMRERAANLGGDVTIASSAGSGATVVAKVPTG